MKKEEIFAHFLALVRLYCREESNIDFYARRIGITPEDLSEIIWDTSESNFTYWLHSMQDRA